MPDSKNRSMIIRGSAYGDPHEQARRAEEFGKAANAFTPEIVSRNIVRTKDGTKMHRMGSTITSSPIYYDPRWGSPDKFYFPRTEEQSNSVWRHLYDKDPAIGVATDIFADLPWSDFDFLGIDDPKIKEVFDQTAEDTNLLMWLPEFTREFLKLGKVIPHLIWNDAKGHWTLLFFHNPDNINVTVIPYLGEDPILDLKPTPHFRQLALSPDPRLRRVREKLPKDLLSRMVAGVAIPLSSDNVSYIARRASPYSMRGTSLYTRLFRITMFEDAIFSASINVAQRNAAPLRIFKLGDRETGWIPDESHERKLLELLAIAESDPMAALVYHYGLEVELVGVSDRLMCHPPGALVTLADGTRREIENLKPGERLQGGSGDPIDVVKVTPLSHEGSIVEIAVQGLPEKIRVTKEHRLLVIRRPPCYNDGESCRRWREKCGLDHTPKCNLQFSDLRSSGQLQPREVRARDLRRGDLLVAPRRIERKEIKPVTLDIARLIGIYLADGSITKVSNGKRRGLQIALDREDEEVVEDLKGILGNLGLTVAVYDAGSPEEDGIHVRANHPQPRAQEIADLLVHYAGRYSRKKKLHEEIFSWEEDLQLELLKGYFLGDGWISTKKRIRGKLGDLVEVYTSTTSPQLAAQIVRLLQINGFAPKLGIREEKYHRDRGTEDAPLRHTITLSCSGAKRMYEILRGESYTGGQRKRGGNRVVGDWVQYLVKDVEHVSYKGIVYNLEVTGDHLYLVGFISSHNSISREWEFIERVKLLAMGVAKSFLVGETSFAAATAGLQTMVERLAALRMKVERQWILPKFLRPIAIANKFYKRTTAELAHRIRIGKVGDEKNLIVPAIKWRKNLEAARDTTLLATWRELHDKGILSDRSYSAGAGLDLDQERKAQEEERKYREELVKKHPELAEVTAGRRAVRAGRQFPGGGDNGQGRAGHTVPSEILRSRIWDDHGRYQGLDWREVEPIVELLREGSTDDPHWRDIPLDANAIEEELIDQGCTDDDIRKTFQVLEVEGVIQRAGSEKPPGSHPLVENLDQAEMVLGREGEAFEKGSDLLAGMPEPETTEIH